MNIIQGKNIFVTGGAGFIGTAIIRKLIDDNIITIYDNFWRDSLTQSGFLHHPNLKIVEGDVLDLKLMAEAMSGADIVIHAAGIAGIDSVMKDPVRTMRVNMIGTANALEAACLNQVNERFINFSTSEVFGSMAFKSSEDHHTIAGSVGEARWTYAVSKLSGEHLAYAYYKRFQLPIVTVRPFNIYGPGQTGEGAIQIFIKRALRNEDIFIYGDGTHIRAWCYIDDFVDALYQCIFSPKVIGESLNLGNSRAIITTLGLAETVCRVVASHSKIVFADELSADIALRIPSVEKCYKLLGFKAKIDLEEGIKKTAEWIADTMESNVKAEGMKIVGESGGGGRE